MALTRRESCGSTKLIVQCPSPSLRKLSASLHVHILLEAYLYGGVKSIVGPSGTLCSHTIIPTCARSGIQEASEHSSTVAVNTFRLELPAECDVCMLHVTFRHLGRAKLETMTRLTIYYKCLAQFTVTFMH